MTKLALCLAVAILAYGQTNRQITFNGRTLTPEQQARLDRLERQYGARIPDGKYWYDNRSGAAGRWGGPGIAILQPGLELGGPMPAQLLGRRNRRVHQWKGTTSG